MPQFDLAIFPGQIFWLVIFFGVLMTYTVTVSVPRMKKVLDERWENTEGFAIEADRLKEQEALLTLEMAEELAGVKKKAHDRIVKLQAEQAFDFVARKKKMMVLAKTQIVEAEARITQQRQYSVFEIGQLTQSITLNLLEKLLPVGGTATEIQDLVFKKFLVPDADSGLRQERRKNGL